MKNMKRLLAVLLAGMLLLTACGIAAAEQEVRKIETAADAEEWVTALLGEHPEELDGAWSMSAQMEAAVTKMGGSTGLAKGLAGLGEIREIGAAYEGDVQGYKAYYIPCVF